MQKKLLENINKSNWIVYFKLIKTGFLNKKAFICSEHSFEGNKLKSQFYTNLHQKAQQEIKQLRREVDDKIKKALDNPLAN